MTARIAASMFILVASAVPALAQAPLVHANPTPGCSVTPAQLEANRKVAMEFFRPGITGEQRLALVDPSYIQHNAALKKAAREQGVSDYDAFRNAFARGGGAGRAGGGRPGGPGGQAAGPQPPPGNDLEIVTAECDVVTIVRKLVRQDPTAAPGTFYETFAFDTFRVRNGKLVEHWDAAVINPPAAGGPGGAGAPGGAPAGRGGQ